MSKATPRPEVIRLMFLPNRKGTLRRDNDHRQKVHRIALRSVKGYVDTSEPRSMQCPRGVDLKKALQEEDRLDYVEKCNRKLVDKMMMIMQGLCRTLISEVSLPDFNPGTLNHRIRRRVMRRIDRDNLALMHRIEGATSSYNKAIIAPKHFQEPHMGLFPREHSVKPAATKLRRTASNRRRKRTKTPPSATTCGRLGSDMSGGIGVRGDGSITSALTEPSAMLALGGKQQEGSTAPFAPEVWLVEEGEESPTVSKVAKTQSTKVRRTTGTRASAAESSCGTPLSPRPPYTSSRAACDGSTRQASSSCRKGRRFCKPVEVRPGESVFHAGVNISGDYVILNITRAESGFGEDGTRGFRLHAYSPSALEVSSLEVPAAALHNFTAGSRTAVKQMFQPGSMSRGRWEMVASHLELRPITPSEKASRDVERHKFQIKMGQTKEKPVKIGRRGSGLGSRMTADSSGNYNRHASSTNVAAASPSSKATPAAAVAKRAPANGRRHNESEGWNSNLELVLTPPSEAVIICLQSMVRGMLTRLQYRTLKIATVSIQAAIRGWRERVGRKRREAATKITAIVRGRQGRERCRAEAAAREIQITAKAWLRKKQTVKDEAASRLQSVIRGRHARRQLARRIGEEKDHQQRLNDESAARRPQRRTRLANNRTPSTNSYKTSSFAGLNTKCVSSNSTVNSLNTSSCRNCASHALTSGGKVWVGKTTDKPLLRNRVEAFPESEKGDGVMEVGIEVEGGEAPRGNDGTTSVLASTPPRGRRPRPPGVRDPTKSPYSRSRLGWEAASIKRSPPETRSPHSSLRQARPRTIPAPKGDSFVAVQPRGSEDTAQNQQLKDSRTDDLPITGKTPAGDARRRESALIVLGTEDEDPTLTDIVDTPSVRLLESRTTAEVCPPASAALGGAITTPPGSAKLHPQANSSVNAQIAQLHTSTSGANKRVEWLDCSARTTEDRANSRGDAAVAATREGTGDETGKEGGLGAIVASNASSADAKGNISNREDGGMDPHTVGAVNDVDAVAGQAVAQNASSVDERDEIMTDGHGSQPALSDFEVASVDATAVATVISRQGEELDGLELKAVDDLV